jgi:hypothetical protein
MILLHVFTRCCRRWLMLSRLYTRHQPPAKVVEPPGPFPRRTWVGLVPQPLGHLCKLLSARANPCARLTCQGGPLRQHATRVADAGSPSLQATPISCCVCLQQLNS